MLLKQTGRKEEILKVKATRHSTNHQSRPPGIRWADSSIVLHGKCTNTQWQATVKRPLTVRQTSLKTSWFLFKSTYRRSKTTPSSVQTGYSNGWRDKLEHFRANHHVRMRQINIDNLQLLSKKAMHFSVGCFFHVCTVNNIIAMCPTAKTSECVTVNLCRPDLNISGG